MPVFYEEEGPSEFLCPRCRAGAEWRFLDEEKSIVQVLCPDCGPFEIARADFELAESDVVEPGERRE